MNISLSPETQLLLEEQMKKGRFATADETMQAALRVLGEATRSGSHEDSSYEDLPADAREAIEESEEQIERGEGRPWSEVRSEILAQFGRE
jgi:Arc/MetJ-type ribon-helix-helix transcriptional regulator